MSVDYWSMKLNNTHVFHKGVYKLVSDLHFDTQPTKHYKYPEDSLPYINFTLNGKSGFRFKDFEIKFPDDQYILTSSRRLVFGKRKMTRTFKLAPSNEHFTITNNLNLNSYLNKTLTIKYSNPDSLFKWLASDAVYSRHVAMTRSQNPCIRYIMWCGIRVGTLKRFSTHLKLTAAQRGLPSLWKKHWEGSVGKKIPFKKIVIKKKNGDFVKLNIAGLNTSWFVVTRAQIASENSANLIAVHKEYIHVSTKNLRKEIFSISISKDSKVRQLYADKDINLSTAQDLMVLIKALHKGDLHNELNV